MSKIIFFDFAHLGYGGGCEKNFMKLGQWLSAKGHDVQFITPSVGLNEVFSRVPGIAKYDVNISDDDLKEKFQVKDYLRFDFFDLLLPTKNRKRILRSFAEAKTVISKNEIFEVLILKYLFRISFKKVVFGFHTPTEYPVAANFKTKLHNLIYGSDLYYRLLGGAGVRCLLLTKEQHEKLLKHKNIRSATAIPNPVDIGKFSQKMYTKKDCFEIYYIGRMAEGKGVGELVTAIKRLSGMEVFKKMNFSFAGNGELEGMLSALPAEYSNCHFLGYRNEVASLYQASDLVVVPSHWESFCYTVAEAQSCGVPVVATNITGPKDIIIDRETGWLIAPNSVDELVDAIVYAYRVWSENFDVYSAIGQKARNNIIDRFEENKINSRIESYVLGTRD